MHGNTAPRGVKVNEKREGGPWIQAAAELDRETKQEHGGDRSKVAARHLEITRADVGTRDGIRRRLEKYALGQLVKQK